MGSYAELTLGDFSIFEDKLEVEPLFMFLFRESDKRILKGIPKELKDNYNIDRFDPDDEEEKTIIKYICNANVLRDRLELMGFTLESAKKDFNEGVKTEIQRMEISIKRPKAYEPEILREFHKNSLKVLSEMSIEKWLDGIKLIRAKKLKKYIRNDVKMKQFPPLISYMLFPDTANNFNYPGSDILFYMRLLLEVCHDSDELIYDVTDLLDGGYIKESDKLVNDSDSIVSYDFLISRKIIILTEGNTDRWILQRSIKILYPHLFEYFHFIDFEGAKVEGGANSLANLVKAFAGAGIVNRMIALFDNDTAGDFAIQSLSSIEIPNNIVSLKYPELEIAKDYPTLGPSGLLRMDVNEMACSIELYLGSDILKNSDGSYIPIQWKGYETKMKKYQGEIINKVEIQKKFDNKLSDCEADLRRISNYDWTGIQSILKKVFTAFKN
jgi:hypothetical protein